MIETEKVVSKARLYLEQKCWRFKESGVDQAAVETCPLCGNSNDKFYINISGGAKDGLWDCKVCAEQGSLWQLMTKMGDRMSNVVSISEAAHATTQPQELPNVAAMKHALHNNPKYGEVLDYLVAERGFSLEVIEKMGLGADEAYSKLWYVIPYFNKNGQLIYAKFRTVPPAAKEFRSTQGREAPLYNEAIIESGLEDILFVEGEADCLSCLSNGIERVVGVPGANVKKAAWITKLDNAEPKKIYVLYDKDRVGQKAANDMAKRIGIEKVYNILLPEFTTIDGKPGKDINEWFRAGHTLEEFEGLKAQAKPFDVDGVADLPAIVEEILTDIDHRGASRAELQSPWPSVNSRLGGENYGEVIGIIAEGKVGKTTFALNWLDYFVEQGIPSMMFCLEMPQKNLVRKWLSYKTQTDDTPGKSKFSKQTVIDGLELAKKMPADLLFAFSRVHKEEEVFELIRQAVRRYGVKVVCFDNLQFLVRSIEHSAQQASVISKRFKELAMELNILILLIIQPNRVREGEIVAARNANFSSAIEKDVDAMLALHRNRKAHIKADQFQGYLESEENFEPQMLVRVDLSRYAAGGVCTLWMAGEVSTVREFVPEEVKATEGKVKSSMSIPVEGKAELVEV